MRILIADDHAVVRRGLRQILAAEFPKAAFGEAQNARETVAMVTEQKWDLVVLDITMPGRSGLDALKDLKEVRPKLPVLIMSVHPEDQFAVRVLKAGAAGYLTKDSAPEQLVQAVTKVLAGKKYVSPALAEALATELGKPMRAAPHKRLSDREFEVLRLIGAGQTVKEIGAALSLSIKTLSTYRTRLLLKMNLRTTAELIRYAVRHGLVK